MKKAAIGFRYISLDDEFIVPDARDIAGAVADRQIDSHTKEKLRKLRNYHNHRDAYNKQKRSVARSIAGRYEAAKRKAEAKGVPWSFDRDTWERAWIDAGWVKHHTQGGGPVPAYAARGSNRYNSTCMVRKDMSLGWSPENTEITFRGMPLVPGSEWYIASPTVAE